MNKMMKKLILLIGVIIATIVITTVVHVTIYAVPIHWFLVGCVMLGISGLTYLAYTKEDDDDE